MKFIRIHLFLALFYILSICLTDTSFPFEKKLWIYWHDQDFSKAPLLAQFCAQKIKISAEKVGFEFILLNRQSVKDYIQNYDQKITKVRENSYQQGQQFVADLIRFHIIHEHGGIWMDIAQILVDDLEWLLNIEDEKYKKLITNKFSESPDVLLFYYSAYQNAAQHFIESPFKNGQVIIYNDIPGYEIWFLAAKKQTALMREIKDTYVKFTQMPFSQIQILFQTEDIYMNNQDFGNYLSANLAISYVLQKRQLEMDKQLTLLSPRRQTVYEFYNLWSLSALLGPLTWTMNDMKSVVHFLDESREEFQRKGFIIKFFLKLPGWVKSSLSENLSGLEKLYRISGFTFQQFLFSEPQVQFCKDFYFLARNSVLYPLFQNSTYLKSGKIRSVTQQQIQRFRDYCQQKYFDSDGSLLASMLNFFFFYRFQSVIIPWYKVHQIQNHFNQKQNEEQRSLKNIFIDKVNQNKGYLLLFSSLFTNFTMILIFMQKIINFWFKKFIHMKNQFHVQIDAKEFKRQQTPQLKGKIINFLKIIKCKNKFLLLLALLIVWTLSLSQYLYVDFFGYRDNLPTILLNNAVIFLLLSFIERNLHQSMSLLILYETSYVYVNYWTVYVFFAIFRKNKIWVIYCSVITALLGSCAFRLLNVFRKSRSSEKEHILYRFYSYLQDKKYHRIMMVLILVIFALIPQLRYLTVYNFYLFSSIPFIPSIFICLVQIHAFIETIKRKNKMEIFRMIILAFITLYLWFYISQRNYLIDRNIVRICWDLIIVGMFQALYVQIGSSYSGIKTNGSNPKQQRWCYLRNLFFFILFFALIILQMCFGSIYFIERSSLQGRKILIEILLLALNTFFISIVINLRNEKRKITYSLVKMQQSLDAQQVQMIQHPRAK